MAEVVDVQARLSSVRPPETALHMGALRIASGSDGLRDAAGAAPLSRSASAQELSEQARAVEASLEMLGLLEPSILPGMSSEGDGREAEGSHSAGGTGTTLAEATRDGSGGGGGGYRHRLSVHISREVRKSRDTDACELVGGAEGDVLPAPTASTAPGQLGEQHPFPHTVAEAEVLEAVTARVGAEIVRDTPADLVLRSVRAFQHEKRRKGRPWADMSTERLRLVLSWRCVPQPQPIHPPTACPA